MEGFLRVHKLEGGCDRKGPCSSSKSSFRSLSLGAGQVQCRTASVWIRVPWQNDIQSDRVCVAHGQEVTL